MPSFREDYGRSMDAKEVAEIFGVDPRTVRKYADLYGGVEVAPGRRRFFEIIIRRILDANILD